MIELKQSTASQEVLLGPFVDATDGNTAETALTIANTDIKIWKAGSTTLANKNSGGATHISNGNYSAVLDATDTDTLGSGAIVVQVAGALAVRIPFAVLTAAEYDRKYGSAVQAVNVTQWGGTNIATPATAGHPVVTMKVGTGTGEINLSSGRVPITSGAQRNVALRLPFTMKDTAGAPLTGSTVTVTYSHDGGTFTSVDTATEIAHGFYYIDLSTTIMNNEQVMLRMSGSGGSGTPADNAVLLLTDP